MSCPHCHTVLDRAADFCPACSRIQPVAEQRSHFEVLGYDRPVLTLDGADMEKRFFQLSKKFHPDRYAGKSALEVQLAHDHSSAINNAYRTLKNPVARAKYLVERELGSMEEKSSHLPADLAEYFFEVQDALDLIQEADSNPPASALAEVKGATEILKTKVRQLESDLQTGFTDYDQKADNRILQKMKEILSHRSYIQSFLNQIDSVLGEDRFTAEAQSAQR